MSRSQSKITLSTSRDIPFNKLVLSQANVRRIKAGVSIEELAEDIARRTLLQSLTVRPVLDADGAETGMFEVPAGGRRYRALELLVKQKRLAKTAPIPCVIRVGGLAEEDSLAENVQRAPLHPLDQFRAFVAMREKGMSEEEIAAAFFVSVAVVKQRLKLASASPRLLDVYAEDGMTLDQLMAFTVSADHARQEQVWEALQHSYNKEPHYIRRLLTEGAVRMSDKRAQFVGIEAYESAGGAVLRDLFQADDGGWLQDPALLARLVSEKLDREAESVRGEGWKWIEVASDFPYGHTFGLRRLLGETAALTDEECAEREKLRTEFDELETGCAEADELPEEIDRRFGEIEAALEAFENRPVVFDPEDVRRAGTFVSIDGSGKLRVERGYVRPEDEAPTAAPDQPNPELAPAHSAEAPAPSTGTEVDATATEPDEDEGMRPIPDRLMTELTAHRTIALRDAVANDPHVAFLAALHVLCLKLFYRYPLDSCLEIDVRNAVFGSQAPGLADSLSAKAIEARHETWAKALPKEPGELWDALLSFDGDSSQALYAHCISLTINAVHETYNRRPKAIAHADRIAEAVALDMAAVGWRPTVDTYLGRVTKARILEAVREATGDVAAERLANLKKPEMATVAEELLAETNWVPEPLRTPGQEFQPVPAGEPKTVSGEDESAASGGEPAMDVDDEIADFDEALPAAQGIAAE